MNTTMKQHKWSAFLKLFGEQNKARPTRLGVYKTEFDSTTDYWIEDGLPLAAINVNAHEESDLSVEIMLGNASDADTNHLTHTVAGARVVKIVLGASGEADSLEIEDAENQTTVLRFEN